MPLHHLKCILPSCFFCFNSSVKLAAFESDPVTQVQSSYFDLQIVQDAPGLAAYKNSGFLPGFLSGFLPGFLPGFILWDDWGFISSFSVCTGR
jgi:hypothetical protein